MFVDLFSKEHLTDRFDGPLFGISNRKTGEHPAGVLGVQPSVPMAATVRRVRLRGEPAGADRPLPGDVVRLLAVQHAHVVPDDAAQPPLRVPGGRLRPPARPRRSAQVVAHQTEPGQSGLPRLRPALLKLAPLASDATAAAARSRQRRLSVRRRFFLYFFSVLLRLPNSSPF